MHNQETCSLTALGTSPPRPSPTITLSSCLEMFVEQIGEDKNLTAIKDDTRWQHDRYLYMYPYI